MSPVGLFSNNRFGVYWRGRLVMCLLQLEAGRGAKCMITLSLFPTVETVGWRGSSVISCLGQLKPGKNFFF